jgi:hypothetical protein
MTARSGLERSICEVVAEPYIYKNSKWEPAGGGAQFVTIDHNLSEDSYRVVGAAKSNGKVCF